MNSAVLALCILIGAVSALPQSKHILQSQYRQQEAEQQFYRDFFQTSTTPHNYIPILSKSEIRRPDGAFAVKYESADGQAFQDQADVVPNSDNTGDVLVRRGSYAYTAPDGTPISVSYIADENGFRVSGAHIPVAPNAAL